MAATKLRLQLTGAAELLVKLKEDGEGLYKPALREGLTEMGVIGAAAGRAAAPRGRTGALGGSVTYKVSPKGTSLSARIVAPARHGGYAYGQLIEYAPKYHHRGWLVGALRSVQGELEGVLVKVAEAIERVWAGA